MDKLIGRYEIRFTVTIKQDWPGLPGGCHSKGSGELHVYNCAIVLAAYTAEDALVELSARLDFLGWKRENVKIASIAPTTEDRPINF